MLPHLFCDTGATFHGETSEATVRATDEDGEAGGRTSIDIGSWSLDINQDDASCATFSNDGSDPSASYDLTSGTTTAVSLTLTSPMDAPAT